MSFPSTPYSPQWREKSILPLLCQRVPRPTPRATTRMFTHHNKKQNRIAYAAFQIGNKKSGFQLSWTLWRGPLRKDGHVKVSRRLYSTLNPIYLREALNISWVSFKNFTFLLQYFIIFLSLKNVFIPIGIHT